MPFYNSDMRFHPSVILKEDLQVEYASNRLILLMCTKVCFEKYEFWFLERDWELRDWNKNSWML